MKWILTICPFQKRDGVNGCKLITVLVNRSKQQNDANSAKYKPCSLIVVVDSNNRLDIHMRSTIFRPRPLVQLFLGIVPDFVHGYVLPYLSEGGLNILSGCLSSSVSFFQLIRISIFGVSEVHQISARDTGLLQNLCILSFYILFIFLYLLFIFTNEF